MKTTTDSNGYWIIFHNPELGSLGDFEDGILLDNEGNPVEGATVTLYPKDNPAENGRLP